MTVSYAMPSEAQRSSTFLSCPICTMIYMDSLNHFTVVSMILGERPTFFAILHCEMLFFISLTLHLKFGKVMTHDPDAPFIPKHDALTYYQFISIL